MQVKRRECLLATFVKEPPHALQRMQAQSSLKQQARLQGVSKTVIQRIMLSVGCSAGSASIQERRSSSLIPGLQAPANPEIV